MYKCPIYAIFGVPCPSCGMTRALMCLVRGDIGDAFSMHPLIFTLPFFIVLILHRKTRKRAVFAMLVLFFAVYIARMIMLFPHTPPMIFNDKSILSAIIDMVHMFDNRRKIFNFFSDLC